VRPSALAVLRLIKSSMSVGNSTGRSPGLAPFQLKNAPLWALGFICPRVHVSALSDRLGSELGVGYLHHRQRPCARRRWLRDTCAPDCRGSRRWAVTQIGKKYRDHLLEIRLCFEITSLALYPLQRLRRRSVNVSGDLGSRSPTTGIAACCDWRRQAARALEA
jgi:hypothetical protein